MCVVAAWDRGIFLTIIIVRRGENSKKSIFLQYSGAGALIKVRCSYKFNTVQFQKTGTALCHARPWGDSLGGQNPRARDQSAPTEVPGRFSLSRSPKPRWQKTFAFLWLMFVFSCFCVSVCGILSLKQLFEVHLNFRLLNTLKSKT